MMQLRLEKDAELDIGAAYTWYEAQLRGLGEAFLAAIDTTIAEIQERPGSFSEVKSGIRRAIVRRFPYGVFYTVVNESILVFAVIHAKRSPESWKTRAM